MSKADVKPKPKFIFFLKNLGLLWKLKRADRKVGEDFVNANKKLLEPIYPVSEGNKGPMEEGMIYVMFNSEGKEDPDKIDTVFRFFWVDAPVLRLSVLDSFIVSEKLKTRKWDEFYPRGVLLNKMKDRYHQEVSEPEVDFLIDGTWDEGYSFVFNDKKLDITAKLNYTPTNDKGILVYYNGRMAISPSMAQKFYDSFAFKVTGEIVVEGQKVELKNGRGIIEHGIGIFSSLHIYDWRWLNLQFPEGAIHLFYHSLDIEEEGIFEAGEGALVIDDEWFHFQPYDFDIEETGFAEDENLPSKVPTAWRVTGGKDASGKNLLDLEVTSTAKISWLGVLGKENQYITNYVLEAEGTWKGKSIKGKGTLENMMHRIIE
ncbi:MAG: hypothetical protein GPJ50_07820 [Candidatus Heimdallarchaeota archaeon]|nr:hypothetical protein [Candidatus Heimdallarchaeota archaeon]